MPSKTLIVDRVSLIVVKSGKAPFLLNDEQLTINDRHPLGFSLVEIIIVVALFAITSLMVTTSYISYEAREKVKNAALQLKGDLRFAQSKAQSGDKGISPDYCPSTSTLAGWYVSFDTASGSNSTYSISGLCISTLPGVGETAFAPKTYNLPKDVVISGINGTAEDKALILFRPLKYEASFHNEGVIPPASPSINFLDDTTGANLNVISGTEITINLSSPDGTYDVKIDISGKIEESK